MDTWLFILLIVAGLAAIGLVWEAFSSAREKRRFPPPGILADAGGYRLHLDVTGREHGSPTVILDSGMVSASPNWAWVQPEVAHAACVVAYDRGGLGWSDPAPKPRDAAQSARELYTALQYANLAGPYILAGHSYGGLVMRAFAALYRDEVAGMVLVDASHPDQWVRFGIPSKSIYIGNKVSSVLARFGIRLFPNEYKLLVDGLPAPQYETLLYLCKTPKALSTAGDAAKAWDTISRPFIHQASGLGDMPLIILSVTEQPRMSEQLTELQAELEGLSTNSKHITVQGAYHEGLVSQQEHARYVTQAILDILQAVRNREARNAV